MPEPIKRKIKLREIKRRLEPRGDIRERLIKHDDKWASVNGESKRFKQIYFDDLNGWPIDHLKELARLGITNPEIIIIGPMYGEDIIELTKHLQQFDIHPQIDVFGLTKTITPDVQKIVRNDFSSNIALETLGSLPEKYEHLVSAMKDKYNLLMCALSAGVHTDYPAHNVFFMAMMLRVNGQAYIELNMNLESTIFNRHTNQYAIVKTIEYIKKLLPRMEKAYNLRYNTNYHFEIDELYPDYIRIRRVA